MYVVADASVFIWGKRPAGELITVPAVEAELKDIRTKSLLAIFEARVESPTSQARKAAERAAAETGDLKVLSPADLDVLAKALEYRAILATDDYALQNVALHLGLKIEPIGQPRIKRLLKHVQRCQGCGRSFEGEACPDCGTPARKKKRCIR
ncbi:MAG: NOB1 family endonuclease [Methanothrix sp.]|nr:NOB1 family endonuclease [Methanothrix sp.]